MCPIAHADGHDQPRAVCVCIPDVTAVIDDVLVGLENAVGTPVPAHVLPDVFSLIEFRAFRRQW